MAHDPQLANHCRKLVAELVAYEISLPYPRAHAEQDATLADHLLTTSALVACLAYEYEERDLLRLAALTHDMPSGKQQAELGDYAEAAAPWVKLLHEQGEALNQKKPISIPASGPERALLLAHLAASERLPVEQRSAFNDHPLNASSEKDEKVALIYGGATKIKGYVFESVKLPEIRGASVLLDHINRLDLPALWGSKPSLTKDETISQAQENRYDKVRESFTKQPFAEDDFALDAPECVLYASGGNILALVPASWGRRMATAIEWCYTKETLVANSVGVFECFSLLELQYGRHPTSFWKDDAKSLLAQDSDATRLLEQSLGEYTFEQKKGFGELVTVLAGLANRRRAGDGLTTGAYRFTSFFELSSHARKCMSCDVRPSTKFMGEDNADDARYFCAACHKKYQAGRWAKKGPDADKTPRESGYEWLRSWGTWLEEQRNVTVAATADDLGEVGQPSDGFVGLIYADGNDVGAYVATLTSISGYRNFAKEMLEVNEEAVAKALVEYIKPEYDDAETWPFEVIAIGGDDVMLFVPGDQALEVALLVAKAFEAGLKKQTSEIMERKVRDITLSVGVLLMPKSTPIRFASELAESLLKSAKNRRYHEKDLGATIDFMALKSVTMIAETIKEYREAAFERKGRKKLRLTQRPYTLEELESLIAATRELKKANFPRSQLYQLAQYLRDGLLMRSAVDYAYLVQRGKERKGANHPFTVFDDTMRELCDGDTWLPWRVLAEQSEWNYDTPLLDIIELYPFIKSR